MWGFLHQGRGPNVSLGRRNRECIKTFSAPVDIPVDFAAHCEQYHSLAQRPHSAPQPQPSGFAQNACSSTSSPPGSSGSALATKLVRHSSRVPVKGSSPRPSCRPFEQIGSLQAEWQRSAAVARNDAHRPAAGAGNYRRQRHRGSERQQFSRRSLSGSLHGLEGGSKCSRSSSSGYIGWKNDSHFIPRREGKNRPSMELSTIGPFGAIERDSHFQILWLAKQKQRFFKEVKDAPPLSQASKNYLDFVCQPEAPMGLVCGYEEYVSVALGGVDLGAEDLEAECNRAPPDFDMSSVCELSTVQSTRLRNALRDYGELSCPTCCHLEEAVFRPAFCRFLFDTGLVSIEPSQGTMGRYHRSLRLYEILASRNTTWLNTVHVPPYATVDQCIALVTQLLGLEGRGAWGRFEPGLANAEDIVEKTRQMFREKCASEQIRIASSFGKDRVSGTKIEMMARFGAPPKTFGGSITDWTAGLKSWVDNLSEHSRSRSIEKRFLSEVALDAYIQDMLIEPGSIYVGIRYAPLLDQLHAAYYDEERIQYNEYFDGVVGQRKLAHMSFPAFFRLCIDFAVFPRLCAFDDVWTAYCRADCVKKLGTHGNPIKVVRQVDFAPRENSKRSDSNSESSPHSSRHSNEASPIADIAHEITALNGFNADVAQMDPTSSMSTLPDSALDAVNVDCPPSQSRRRRTLANTPLEQSRLRSHAWEQPAVAAAEADAATASCPDPGTLEVIAIQSNEGIETEATPKARRIALNEMARNKNDASKKNTKAIKHAGKIRCLDEQEEPLAPVRVKVQTDSSWLRKPLPQMTQLERRVYIALLALGSCEADHFLGTRGLFGKVVPVSDEKGRVTAADTLKAFERLGIKVAFADEGQMEEMFAVVQKDCEGLLEPVDIEKAVESIRKQWHVREEQSHLGALARELDQEANREVAFGPSALFETLMRLTFQHMHGNGVPIKSSVPAGLKGLWLVAFLQCRYDSVVRKFQSCGNTDPDPKFHSSGLTSCPTTWQSLAASVPQDDSFACFGIAPATVGQSVYVPLLSRLVQAKPNLFTLADDTGAALEWHTNAAENIALASHTGNAEENDDSSTKQCGIMENWLNLCRVACAVCGRVREGNGFGSVYCHGCSGVDEFPLSKSILYPLITRSVPMPQSMLADQGTVNHSIC